MNATARLAEVVRRAYRVFERPKPATLGVCRGCCMDPEIEADFLNHAPRDLPEDYVRDWFFAAFADDFGKPHIAWLLPRILEIVAAGGEVASVGEEAAFGRIGQTGYPDGWTAAEQAVVQDFFEALLKRVLEDPARAAYSLDDLLCMTGEAGADVAPLIARVEALDDAKLVELLWSDIFWSHGKIPVNAFWSHSPQKEQVWEWETSQHLADRLLAYGAGGAPGGGADRALRDCALRLAETIMAASDPPQG
jgi:hypothetical protein